MAKSVACYLTLYTSIALLAHRASSQLVVNVKNKGGEVLRQSINANNTQDTIRLEFKKTDGTLVTQFVDFANEVQIFRAIVLGEEERGQTGHQVLCFISRVIRHEFISSDAMSKLRQKNPGAIRHPEEDKDLEAIQTDLMVDIGESHILSPYIPVLCSGAKESTYTRDTDLKLIAHTLNKDYTQLLGATSRRAMSRITRCREIQELWRPCLCHYRICVGWYPCGLKYCKGKDSSGKVVSYRCGIKTCSKCRRFEFYAHQKQLCIWDEAPWGLTNTNPQEEIQDNLEENGDDEDSKPNGMVEEPAQKPPEDANELKR